MCDIIVPNHTHTHTHSGQSHSASASMGTIDQMEPTGPSRNSRIDRLSAAAPRSSFDR